ncbi:ribonuclease H-like domain-containing protein, partial [Tanacetum coccineum]
SNSSLEEFQQPEFEGYGPKAGKSVYVETSNEVKKTHDASLVEELVSEKENQTVFPTKIKLVKQQDKIAKKPVKPKSVNTTRPNSVVVNAIRDNQANAVKASACWVWRLPNLIISRSLMEDMLPLVEESEEERSLVKMCDKKNCVLFTDTACFVLSPDFKLPDESQNLLKVPRKNNMYSVDIKNIVPKESLTSSKDATSGILKIKCDNGTEFKNRVMNEFCEKKVIKREYRVARTPQQNGVVERKNRTLIEAARTMLADSKLPTKFWAEVVNTACYVQNRIILASLMKNLMMDSLLDTH